MMPDESLGCPYKKPWYMATAVLDGAVTSAHSRRVKARNLLIYEVARPLCDLTTSMPRGTFCISFRCHRDMDHCGRPCSRLDGLEPVRQPAPRHGSR